jgi:hypothetical protein
MESTDIPGFGSYILAIFLTPIYCITRGKWLGFVLSTILYILAGFTILIFGLGIVFWLLAALPAAFSLRNEILEAHARKTGEATAKAIAAISPRSVSPVDVRSVENSNELSENKICPLCAESVKAAAVICKHCGHKFCGSMLDADALSSSKTEPFCEGALASTSIQHAEMLDEALEKHPDTTFKRTVGGGFCSQCGTAFVEASQFCYECGQRFSSQV